MEHKKRENREQSDDSAVSKANPRRRPGIILLAVLPLIVSILLFFWINPHHFSKPQRKKSANTPPKEFLESLTLESLCASTVWQDGVFLNCTNIDGNIEDEGEPRAQGTTNVRNMIVTCLRWAIDGGMGFIIPRIAIRSKSNLKSFNEWSDLSYYFDTNVLQDTMRKDCPQLRIYNSDYIVGALVRPKYETVPPDFHFGWGEYRSHVMDTLRGAGISLSKEKRISIHENDAIFGWDFENDSFEVHKSLMNAVQFSPFYQRLGDELFFLIKDKKYIGFHLRAESDWTITDYPTQVHLFLKELSESPVNNTQTVYIAVGSQELEEDFRSKMKACNLTVISKWSVANEALLNRLNLLGFDQLAIIDQYILTRSTYFFGLGLSSYSYAIAWDRGNGNLTNCDCNLFIASQPAFICCY